MTTFFMLLNSDCLPTILSGPALIQWTPLVGGETIGVRLLWSTTI